MKVKSLFEATEKNLVGKIRDGRSVTINGKRRTVWNGNFHCSFSTFTSLEGAPKEVGGYFYCNNNYLTSLKGGPEEVGTKTGGNFDCFRNLLTSLEGFPRVINGGANCTDNPHLKSISGIHVLVDSVSGILQFDDVTHVLGLCLIPGIEFIRHGNGDVQRILNKYRIAGRNGLCDAQDELLDLGLDKYALL